MGYVGSKVWRNVRTVGTKYCSILGQLQWRRTRFRFCRVSNLSLSFSPHSHTPSLFLSLSSRLEFLFAFVLIAIRYFIEQGYAVVFLYRRHSLQPYGRHFLQRVDNFLDYIVKNEKTGALEGTKTKKEKFFSVFSLILFFMREQSQKNMRQRHE
jgi:hypothetical protein